MRTSVLDLCQYLTGLQRKKELDLLPWHMRGSTVSNRTQHKVQTSVLDQHSTSLKRRRDFPYVHFSCEVGFINTIKPICHIKTIIKYMTFLL